MKTWFIKEGYLIEDKDGIIVLKSSGDDKQRINNIQVTLDHLNNCTLVYSRFYFLTSRQEPGNIVFDGNPFTGFGYVENKKLQPFISNISLSEVEPQYVETRDYTYSTGWLWWKKDVTKSYQIVREGLVRQNHPITRHTAQGNRWMIESQSGEFNSNV